MNLYFEKEARELEKLLRKNPGFGRSPLWVFLEGDLGVGKTTFVRSFLAVVGGEATQVQSPTFLKLLEYKVRGFGEIIHIDAYRMDSVREIEKLALESYQEATAFFVEWPALFEEQIKEHPEAWKALGFVLAARLRFELNAQSGARSVTVR